MASKACNFDSAIKRLALQQYTLYAIHNRCAINVIEFGIEICTYESFLG
jgi:hypothetical protein